MGNLFGKEECPPPPPCKCECDCPDCPDCEESLTLQASYYELPNTDLEENDIFISLITATVVDSTENDIVKIKR